MKSIRVLGIRQETSGYFCQSGGVPIRRVLFCPNLEGPNFVNPKGSQFGVVLFLSVRRGPIFVNPEGSLFGGVQFLPIRWGPIFVNPEGSQFGSVLFLSIQRGPRNNERINRDPKTSVDESKTHSEKYKGIRNQAGNQ